MRSPRSRLSVALLFSFMIAAVGCGSSSGTSSSTTDGSTSDTTLGAVTGLKVDAGNAQNTLTWEALTGASSYNIYYETGSSSAFANGLVSDCSGDRIEGITGTSYTHTGLSNGVTYRYNIVGVGPNSEGTCGVNVTAPNGTPTAPTTAPVYGCNHPDAINYDSSVTVYVPGTCWWPQPTPTPAPVSLVCLSGMVKFTGGTFTMGDGDASCGGDCPAHPVTLSDFCIDAKEVTQTQYSAWGGDGGHPGYGFPGANNPADKVDWANAQAYCGAQGKRLPTEAEWEYAARNGGRAVTFATGLNGTPDCATANAWIGVGNTICVGNIVTVGSSPASPSGLFDMAGNINEWTGDWYDAAYYTPGQVDPTGPGTGTFRVIRGGGYSNTVDFLRASKRSFSGPANRFPTIGFRCGSN